MNGGMEMDSGALLESGRAEEAKEILRTLRKCRSRLNSLELHHPAAYTDIAIQLLKQSLGAEAETGT